MENAVNPYIKLQESDQKVLNQDAMVLQDRSNTQWHPWCKLPSHAYASSSPSFSIENRTTSRKEQYGLPVHHVGQFLMLFGGSPKPCQSGQAEHKCAQQPVVKKGEKSTNWMIKAENQNRLVTESPISFILTHFQAFTIFRVNLQDLFKVRKRTSKISQLQLDLSQTYSRVNQITRRNRVNEWL